MMSRLSNEHLERYYRAEVEMRRDTTKRAIKEVMPVVEKIMQHIHEEDPRFDKNLYYVGSQFQGLKVKRADEFDFSVPIRGLPGMFWGPYEQRYYRFNKALEGNFDTLPDNIEVVRSNVALPAPPTGYMYTRGGHIEDPRWQAGSVPLQFDGDIIPFLVKQHFKKLLQEAIRSLYKDTSDGRPRLGRKAHGPALTIRIPFSDPQDPDMTEISIDLSPQLPLQMTFEQFIGWPRSAQWPSAEKVAKLKLIGVNATAKKPFYWMRCFANCEKELMADIDKDGGCRKKCHRIMKRIREQIWCTTNKPGVSSYILKNILWWECEKFPNSADWSQDKLAVRFTSMTERLLRCLRQDKLDQYFEPAFNLLGFDNPVKRENLRLEKENIEAFHRNPMHYLNKY